MTTLIDNVLGQLETVGRDTADYKTLCPPPPAQLVTERSPADVRKLVDGLIAATRAMEQRTKSLEGELQALLPAGQRTAHQAGRCAQGKPDRSPDRHRQPQGLRRSDARRRMAGVSQNGEAVSLLMCDIDHFKKFNDTWGHQTGDQVLRLVASCLSENVKGRDTAARYGGEEFAVLLRGTALGRRHQGGRPDPRHGRNQEAGEEIHRRRPGHHHHFHRRRPVRAAARRRKP